VKVGEGKELTNSAILRMFRTLLLLLFERI
jgi:hypothetical protein